VHKSLTEWRSQLKDVVVPRPFALDAFLANLADARQREIVVVVEDLGREVSGLWVRYPDRDVVFVEETAAPAQHEPIILHEIGHMICDHPHDPVRTAELRQRLCPHVDVRRWEQLAARTGYLTEAERQAERFARALSALSRQDRRVAQADDDEGRSVVGQILDIFG
jgi:hypothetical protein